MKKVIVALSFVLGLFSISATQAQMRIYNSSLIKFGNINNSPTLSKGLEVVLDNFLFSGQKVQCDFSGVILEISGNLTSFPSSQQSLSTNAIIVDPSLNKAKVLVSAPKNAVSVGSTDKPFHSIYATDLYGKNSALSDRRYKTNIVELTTAMDKIMRLRPVKFDYLGEKDNINTLDSTRMNNVGLIAQELLEVVPEAVQHLLPEDIYMVAYTTLIPYLIKSIQEQQILIENQQLQIEELQNKIGALSTDK